MNTLIELEPGQLCASPFNRRRWRSDDFQDPKLVGLSENIAAHGGNFEPIIVRRVEGREAPYEIVAGECRWRAVRMLWTRASEAKASAVWGPVLPGVLAIVRELTDAEAFAITMDENRRRENLSPLEEADTLAAYMEAHPGWSVADAAGQLGVSVTVAARRLSLRNLSAGWQEVMVEGERAMSGWPAGHFERVAALPQGAQDRLLAELAAEERNDWGFDEIRMWSLDDLRRKIAEYFYTLKDAAWSLDDAELPGGACSACRKRSSCQPDLFDAADFNPHGSPRVDVGADRCLDVVCFKQKQDALLARVKQETEVDLGREVVLAQHGDYGARGTAFAEQKLANVHRMRESKKGARGAVPVLLVGQGATGKVQWMVPDRVSEKAPEPMEARRAKLETTRLRAVCGELVAWIEERIELDELFMVVGPQSARKLEPLALVMACPDCRTRYVSPGWAGMALELSEKGAEAMVKELVIGSLRELAFKYRVLADKQGQPTREWCTSFCELFGLDFQALWKEACVKHPEPRAWAGLGEDGEPKGVNAFTRPPVKKGAGRKKGKAAA